MEKKCLTQFIIPQKNNSCHFYSFIISVYISNIFASLVVQFELFTFCVLDLQILIVSLLSSNV